MSAKFRSKAAETTQIIVAISGLRRFEERTDISTYRPLSVEGHSLIPGTKFEFVENIHL